MTYPLEGIKIVDFGVYLAGPFAGRLLGDMGASIIKVETPEGEVPRPKNEMFIPNMLMTYSNRGRNVAIDLKHPEGLAVARKLIAEADIVSQNQRIGVAERLGIGYEDCRAINPDVIYLASPGYGTSGPRALHPSFEPLNSAFVGQHYRSGGEGNPPVGSISLDAFCGLIAANGLLMALLHRDLTGEGQYLMVSQLACAMYYTSDTFRFSDGTLGPLPQLDSEQRGLGPLNRLYQTSDDWICICCEKDHEWSALCTALGLPELAADARFRTAEQRAGNGEALGAILDEAFQTRSSQEWAGILERHGAPAEVPVAGGQPGFDNPDYLAYGLITEYQHEIWGHTIEPRIIPVLSETPGRTVTKSPFLGEHTREIMEELGYGRGEVDDLVRQRVILARPQEMAMASR